MKKAKQILAWAGIILLVGLYISTLVFSLMKGALAYDLFRASVACTILVPILMYAMILMNKVLDKRDKNDKDTDK